ncbi:hypothetical protein [Thiolapillus sp.]|uniref:hypothetical protein n=1 Tax=Thiolapillus sp. TaxID=2017437 RepID=UPI0025DECE38|nr:hypothetical protein [Thiolapillus sp.]
MKNVPISGQNLRTGRFQASFPCTVQREAVRIQNVFDKVFFKTKLLNSFPGIVVSNDADTFISIFGETVSE